MKKNLSLILILLLAIPASIGLYLLFLVLEGKAAREPELGETGACAQKSTEELANVFSVWSGEADPDKFPYEQFKAPDCLPDVAGIVREIRYLQYQMPQSGQAILKAYYRLLTDELWALRQDSGVTGLPQLANWAAAFGKIQAVLEEEDLSATLRAIRFYWYIKINALILEEVNANPGYKYSFDYRFAEKIMSADRFYLSTGKTKLEKTIQYLLEGRYAYLFNRLWHGTGWLFKAGLLALGFAFCAACSKLFHSK